MYESLDCDKEREEEAQRLFDEFIQQKISQYKVCILSRR